MRWEEKFFFQGFCICKTFAFSCIAFPEETLIHLQNVCILPKYFVFALQSIAILRLVDNVLFPHETLHSLAFLQEIARKIIVFPQENLFTYKTFAFSQEMLNLLMFSCKSIAFHKKTMLNHKTFALTFKSTVSPKRCVHLQIFCVPFQKHCVPSKNFTFTCNVKH